MKPTYYKNRKWLLAGSLLGILGLGGFYHSYSPYKISKFDFASTNESKIEGKLTTEDGVIPVTYIKKGEDKVIALVPKINTEGKICEDCGYDAISIASKNTDNIEELNVELLKKIKKSKKSTEKESEEKSSDDRDDDRSISGKHRKTEKADQLDKIRDACDRYDQREERSDRLDCVKERFIDLLHNKKAMKDVTSSELMRFYRSEIQTPLLEQLKEARRLAVQSRRSKAYGNNLNSLALVGDTYGDSQDLIDKSLETIEDLLREIPSKHEMIRQHLIVAEEDILKYEGSLAKQTQAQANAIKGTPEGVFLSQEAVYELRDLQNLSANMTDRTISALSSASDIESNKISDYTTYIQQFNSSLNAALAGQGNLLNGQINDPTLDLTGRVNLNGRNLGNGNQLPPLNGGITQLPQYGNQNINRPNNGRVPNRPNRNLPPLPPAGSSFNGGFNGGFNGPTVNGNGMYQNPNYQQNFNPNLRRF